MKKIIFLTSNILLSVFCFSQTSEDAIMYLSLDSCRNLALQNNSKAKIAALQIEKIKYEKKSYFADFFPKISGNAMYLLTSADMNYHKRITLKDTELPSYLDLLNNIHSIDFTIPLQGFQIPIYIPFNFSQYRPFVDAAMGLVGVDLDINIKPNNTFLTGVQLQQPIFWGGKIIAANRMAKIGLELTKLNLERTNSQITVAVDSAYYLLIKANEMYKIVQNVKINLQKISEQVDNAIESGFATTNDKLKVESKISEVELMLRQANNGIKLAKMNLCYIIGINMFSDIFPSDALTATIPEILSEPLPDVSVRTEYTLLNKQLEFEKQKINLARSDYLPQLGVMGGYNYINGILLNDEKLFNKGSFSAIVQLKVPIFNGLKGYNKIKSAKTDYKIVQLENEQKFELLRLEMQRAYNNVDEAFFKIQVLENQHKQAKENFRIISDRYELGFDTLLTLLEAQTLMFEVESRILDAKIAFKTAESEYYRTIKN